MVNPIETKPMSGNGHKEQGESLSPTMREEPQAMTPFPPFSETPAFQWIRRFSEELDRYFESFGFRPLSSTFPFPFEQPFLFTRTAPRFYPTTFTPALDVFARGEDLIVRAELPGIKAQDVNVEIDETGLTIRGESRFEGKKEEEGSYYTERRYGTFYRHVLLPREVRSAEALAEFKDGVLEITMPAPPEQAQRGRRLEVTEGSSNQRR
jgi:HSP20 family protein